MKLPLLDRYLINDKLGEGGFGTVYHGWDQQQDREVAIKALPRAKLSVVEGQILAGFDHENIVQLYDIISTKDFDYIIMEYVNGPLLLKQKLTITEILDLGIQICSALDVIHQSGLCHLDVKPQNILRDPQTNICKLTDFGVAAKVKLGERQVIGTPKYIAPEQRRGGTVDRKADIYGLARVLMALFENHNYRIPVKLKQILLKASHDNCEYRFNDVIDLKKALIQIKIIYYSEENVHVRRLPIKPLFDAVVSAFAVILLARQPLIGSFLDYSLDFKLIIAPLMVGITGYLCLPLACFLIIGIVLLQLFVTWPGIAVVSMMLILLIADKIYRHPTMFLVMIYSGCIFPDLMWVPPIIAGFFCDWKAALFTGIVYPIGLLLVNYSPSIINTDSFTANWLITAFRALSFNQIYDQLLNLGFWFYQQHLETILIGIILGICTAWLSSLLNINKSSITKPIKYKAGHGRL